MDARFTTDPDDPVILTGHAHVIVEGEPCDPSPYLKAPKLRKYMGIQDDLAVVAAARALESAGVRPSLPEEVGGSSPERIGLYLVVGYIPFEQRDLDPLLAASVEQGRFSMERFSTAGFRAVNGLLTFRCLPNMPAFHISANCDIQGPYFVTYPGPGQFYLALEEAVNALREGTIDIALVGGVAHQRNFLVAYHFSRIDVPIAFDNLRDAAGCLVLERARNARARTAVERGRLLENKIDYVLRHPFEEGEADFLEEYAGFRQNVAGYLGPASLPVRISMEASDSGCKRHLLHSRDGFVCQSTWEL